MKSSRPEGARLAGIVAIAASFLFFTILVLFLLLRQGEKHQEVNLPEAPVQQVQPEQTENAGLPFASISPENVGKAVATLSRPLNYYEVCTVQRFWGEQQDTETVERWVAGEATKIVILSQSGKKTYLSDGKTVWFWYDDGADGVASLPLKGTTADDLAGVPSYESVVHAEDVSNASYVVLQDSANCLFAELAQDEDGFYEQLWVDVSTGTLYRANTCMQDSLIYQMQQTKLTIYAANDAALNEIFLLPDGSSPFISAATESEAQPAP